MAIVSVVRSHHLGRVGHFCEIAAAQGIATFLVIGGFAKKFFLVPPGGAEPTLGANPLAFGFPARGRPPIVLDIATTSVAGGKVLLAREEGRRMSPGFILDKFGRPSTDPNDMFAGGV